MMPFVVVANQIVTALPTPTKLSDIQYNNVSTPTGYVVWQIIHNVFFSCYTYQGCSLSFSLSLNSWKLREFVE